jgi:hypothetical protein
MCLVVVLELKHAKQINCQSKWFVCQKHPSLKDITPQKKLNIHSMIRGKPDPTSNIVFYGKEPTITKMHPRNKTKLPTSNTSVQ